MAKNTRQFGPAVTLCPECREKNINSLKKTCYVRSSTERKALKAEKLRAEGKSFQEISQVLGVTVRRVQQIFNPQKRNKRSSSMYKTSPIPVKAVKLEYVKDEDYQEADAD